MPNPDAKLDLVVDGLGKVNVPALVEYLRSAHPEADPFALAAKVISLIEASSYTMDFEDLPRE